MAKQKSLTGILREYKKIIEKGKEEITNRVGEITDSVVNAAPNVVSCYEQLIDRLYKDARQGAHILADTLHKIAEDLKNPYEKGESPKEESERTKYSDILSYMKEHKYRGESGFNKTLDELNIKGRAAHCYRMAFLRYHTKRKKRK